MYAAAKRYTLAHPGLRRTIGYILVCVGFLGIILPIIPGVVLLVIGCEMLGTHLGLERAKAWLALRRSR